MPGLDRLFAGVAAWHRECRKQVFESAQGILRVIKFSAAAKNFHKFFNLPGARALFQSAWTHYGDK
jgi:hypothetical protein